MQDSFTLPGRCHGTIVEQRERSSSKNERQCRTIDSPTILGGGRCRPCVEEMYRIGKWKVRTLRIRSTTTVVETSKHPTINLLLSLLREVLNIPREKSFATIAWASTTSLFPYHVLWRDSLGCLSYRAAVVWTRPHAFICWAWSTLLVNIHGDRISSGSSDGQQTRMLCLCICSLKGVKNDKVVSFLNNIDLWRKS